MRRFDELDFHSLTNDPMVRIAAERDGITAEELRDALLAAQAARSSVRWMLRFPIATPKVDAGPD